MHSAVELTLNLTDFDKPAQVLERSVTKLEKSLKIYQYLHSRFFSWLNSCPWFVCVLIHAVEIEQKGDKVFDDDGMPTMDETDDEQVKVCESTSGGD
ncbi:unnamed protein product [Didymodactylos carnosus]|uniref:Uncharacterized protein n=1 Tax=Didymodactylos carnosus TaxID=1234261 RepID=A0A814G3X7_9BILA|nr:unnamed protein product [Didymodactylos carnosus]CAF0988798.1 unnamed protein product [Didymodactylos carnosus]CAF3660131.1 unnamed protein product [Didymodactylos carnosus]CAF3760935.1 unnamed protein product [Didymodactylos carnosus]